MRVAGVCGRRFNPMVVVFQDVRILYYCLAHQPSVPCAGMT